MATVANFKELLGWGDKAIYLGHIKEEFPSGLPISFEHAYQLAQFGVWACDERVFRHQEFSVFGRCIEPRRCAFCCRSTQDGATFRSDAHAVPIALGNRRLISREECDDCNNTLGDCESELVRLLEFERVFGSLKGRGCEPQTDLNEAIHAQSEGRGRPIRLSVDPSHSKAPKELDANTMQIPVELGPVRHVLAIRSIIRSAWMILAPEDRRKVGEVRLVANGENVEFPFEFIHCFSPGAPHPFGRLRIWIKRDIAETADLPPSVVSFSIFNTTLVWRSPLNGKYVRGPLPPIPAYDSALGPNIEKLTSKSDVASKQSYVLDIHFDRKELAEDPISKSNGVISSPKKDPFASLLASQDVEVSIETLDRNGDAPWLRGAIEIKKFRADFNGIARAEIKLRDSGIVLVAVWDNEVQAHRVTLKFSAHGISAEVALKGLDFVERFASNCGTMNVRILATNEIIPFPLTSSNDIPPLDGVISLRRNLEAIVLAGARLGVDLSLPSPSSDGIDERFTMAALGIAHGCVVIPIDRSMQLPMPFSMIETLGIKKGSVVNLPLVVDPDPFADLPGLSRDAIGPIHTFLMQTTIFDLTPPNAAGSAVVTADGGHLMHVFERFQSACEMASSESKV